MISNGKFLSSLQLIDKNKYVQACTSFFYLKLRNKLTDNLQAVLRLQRSVCSEIFGAHQKSLLFLIIFTLLQSLTKKKHREQKGCYQCN